MWVKAAGSPRWAQAASTKGSLQSACGPSKSVNFMLNLICLCYVQYSRRRRADYYNALGIGWHFQANAYADAAYSRKWLRAFIATLKAKGLGKFALKETCFTLLATVSKTQKANAQTQKFSLERQYGSHARVRVRASDWRKDRQADT